MYRQKKHEEETVYDKIILWLFFRIERGKSMRNLKNTEILTLNINSGINVTEEDVRQAVNEDIKNYLLSNYNKSITFQNEVKTKNNSYIDSKYGDFLIEYKKPTLKIGEKERTQLFSYLESLNEDSWGILTNGSVMEIYHYSFLDNQYVLNENYSGQLNEEQFKYICNVLSNKDQKILTKLNIIEHFGVQKNKNIIKRIYQLLSDSDNNKTKLLYKEWQKLFHISESEDKFDLEKKQEIVDFYESVLDSSIDDITKTYKALFSIQTYYAIVTKIILYKLILNEKSKPLVRKRFLKTLFIELEDNSFFRKNNIVNLVDGDFFSWYLDEFEEKEFEYFFNLISDLTTVKTDKINLLFITFYENIFPFHVRHAMGEYYTPFYLADKIVSKSLEIANIANPSILDPTCGSGIFLMSAISRGYKKIYGIDINPLSVLTSKINYLLNNFDLSNKIEIPIYLGDSTYLPVIRTVNGIVCFEYELLTSIKEFPKVQFLFPEDIVKENRFFEILDEIEVSIVNKNKKQSIEIIKSYRNFHYSDLSNYYNSLLDDLYYLEELNLNSIWLKIIGNYLKSGSLRDVDIIVGNPPWVKWSNLPENYKENIKEKCRLDGVFSRDTNVGGVDLNISALIAHVSIRDRLNIDGVLGFIMPDSILFNKSFEGFRDMKTSDNQNFYLVEVERWNNKTERPFDPVSIDFSEYYFSFNKVKDIKVFDRKRNLETQAFMIDSGFNNHYLICTPDDFEIIKDVLGRNSIVFRSGLGLPKGGHYLLEFKKEINDKEAEFFRYKRFGSTVKLSSETIILEKDLVFPFIKSDQIDDNTIEFAKTYCLFPYHYGSRHPMELDYLRDNYPKFYNYYMSDEVQRSINTSSTYNDRIQSNKIKTGIFRVGDYTYGDNYLATRDNTKSVFSIISRIKTHWGDEKIPLFDGHVNYTSLNENGLPLTEDEMKRYFKFFTKQAVKLYVKYASDSRSISGRLYNDINLNG